MEGRSADSFDGPLEFDGGSGIQKLPPDDENTATLESFLEKDGDDMSWELIEKLVTASALCEASNPIEKAFKVSRKLLDLAETTTVNTKSLEELAVKVQDFAFDLLDQVERKEDMYIKDEDMDRSGSLFSKITDYAIAEKQKKFLSHPFVLKRVEKRWKYGLSKDFQSKTLCRVLLVLIMMVDVILTPILLPLIAFAFYKSRRENKGKTKILEIYKCYLDTPYVIFVKAKMMMSVFIILHFWISIHGSSVSLNFEEALVFFFFLGFFGSEIHQCSTWANKVYSRDVWNYVDFLVVAIYSITFSCRIVTLIIGGDSYHNRWLEIANYGYGLNTLFLTLRFSSVLQLSSVVGPLQLALFTMCRDLLVILIQFAFVVVAFSMAITKCYTTETSYLMLQNNQSHYTEYCDPGNIECFVKSTLDLVWSIFGMTHAEEMRSHTNLTSTIVLFLFLSFLVLSVLMLVNILVALLTTTYANCRNRWKINYTYSRCVTEEHFRRMHCVVVPFNLLSLPLASLYWRMTKDTRIKRKDSKNNKYKDFLEGTFFPIITKRYKKKYKGSFPLTVDGKLDNLEERLNRVEKLKILEKKEQESQEPDRLEKMEEKRTMTSKGREKQKNREEKKQRMKLANPSKRKRVSP